MIHEILSDSAKMDFVMLSFFVLLFLTMACVLLNISKQFVAHARLVKARITKLEPYAGRIRASLLLKDSLGKEIEASIMVSTRDKYKENDEIELLSSKDKPEKVKFNSYESLWMVPIAFFQTAILMCIILGILVHAGTVKLPF